MMVLFGELLSGLWRRSGERLFMLVLAKGANVR
jgi:hypothetical protein